MTKQPNRHVERSPRDIAQPPSAVMGIFHSRGRLCYRRAFVAVLLAALWTGNLAPAAEQRIEVRAGAVRATRYLSEQEQADVRKSNSLRGFAEADYAFNVPKTGWYELWIAACGWTTDLLLDGQFLIHSSLKTDDWKPQRDAQKVLNVHLSAGEHVLSFHRTCPFGLPWMSRFFLEPARDATGMVRLTPKKDYMVFRRGEKVLLLLQAGRLPAAYHIHLCFAIPKPSKLRGKVSKKCPQARARSRKRWPFRLTARGPSIST